MFEWELDAYLASREFRAYLLLTNRHQWEASEDWCVVFGCCGWGWSAEEDEASYNELRTAHLMAGLPTPNWIEDWHDMPPRRRDPQHRSMEMGIPCIRGRGKG